ncbi:hypothetical protein M422DRAFT_273761 [Sphaerobolus stellatus SS14]|uniref:Uncharacterized protein n=1 Tax=Sphaerobolus stellatus (strain SS14) TaxID=990650 RepID=A0A0C9TTU9_SPHS4|nr:hypothetical protein M422DRAFT_273761 [Sphaerobolus stellatus SS14]
MASKIADLFSRGSRKPPKHTDHRDRDREFKLPDSPDSFYSPPLPFQPPPISTLPTHNTKLPWPLGTGKKPISTVSVSSTPPRGTPAPIQVLPNMQAAAAASTASISQVSNYSQGTGNGTSTIGESPNLLDVTIEGSGNLMDELDFLNRKSGSYKAGPFAAQQALMQEKNGSVKSTQTSNSQALQTSTSQVQQAPSTPPVRGRTPNPPPLQIPDSSPQPPHVAQAQPTQLPHPQGSQQPGPPSPSPSYTSYTSSMASSSMISIASAPDEYWEWGMSPGVRLTPAVASPIGEDEEGDGDGGDPHMDINNDPKASGSGPSTSGLNPIITKGKGKKKAKGQGQGGPGSYTPRSHWSAHRLTRMDSAVLPDQSWLNLGDSNGGGEGMSNGGAINNGSGTKAAKHLLGAENPATPPAPIPTPAHTHGGSRIQASRKEVMRIFPLARA